MLLHVSRKTEQMCLCHNARRHQHVHRAHLCRSELMRDEATSRISVQGSHTCRRDKEQETYLDRGAVSVSVSAFQLHLRNLEIDFQLKSTDIYVFQVQRQDRDTLPECMWTSVENNSK